MGFHLLLFVLCHCNLRCQYVMAGPGDCGKGGLHQGLIRFHHSVGKEDVLCTNTLGYSHFFLSTSRCQLGAGKLALLRSCSLSLGDPSHAPLPSVSASQNNFLASVMGGAGSLRMAAIDSICPPPPAGCRGHIRLSGADPRPHPGLPTPRALTGCA